MYDIKNYSISQALAHAFNFRTQKAKAGESVNLRLSWTTELVKILLFLVSNGKREWEMS